MVSYFKKVICLIKRDNEQCTLKNKKSVCKKIDIDNRQAKGETEKWKDTLINDLWNSRVIN